MAGKDDIKWFIESQPFLISIPSIHRCRVLVCARVSIHESRLSHGGPTVRFSVQPSGRRQIHLRHRHSLRYRSVLLRRPRLGRSTPLPPLPLRPVRNLSGSILNPTLLSSNTRTTEPYFLTMQLY